MQKLMQIFTIAIIISYLNCYNNKRGLTGVKNDKGINANRILTSQSQQQITLTNNHEEHQMPQNNNQHGGIVANQDIQNQNDEAKDSNQCQVKQNIDDLLEESEKIDNNGFYSIYIAKNLNGPDDQIERQLRYGKFRQHQSKDKLMANEIKIAKKLNTIEGINVPKFQDCYVQSINHEDKTFFALQYEYLGDNLDCQYNQKAEQVDNIGLMYTVNYPVEYRLVRYLELFQTLQKIHDNGITLRTIQPNSIYANKILIDGRSEAPEDMKFYLTNFAYSYDKNDNSGYTYFENNNYIHPQTTLYESGENKQYNDVYQLCLSLFQIEMYKSITKDHIERKFFVPTVTGGYKIRQYDQVGKEISLSEKQVQISCAIDYQRNIIEQYVFQNLQQENNIFDKIYNALNKQNEQSQLNELVKVCSYDCRCIMYAGIRQERDSIPTAGFIAKALEMCMNKRLLLI